MPNWDAQRRVFENQQDEMDRRIDEIEKELRDYSIETRPISRGLELVAELKRLRAALENLAEKMRKAGWVQAAEMVDAERFPNGHPKPDCRSERIQCPKCKKWVLALTVNAICVDCHVVIFPDGTTAPISVVDPFRREQLIENRARGLVSHWNEFGPANGFEEQVAALEKSLKPDSVENVASPVPPLHGPMGVE